MTHKQTSRQTHLFSIFKEAESRPDKIESTSNNVQVRKKRQHRRRACDLLASEMVGVMFQGPVRRFIKYILSWCVKSKYSALYVGLTNWLNHSLRFYIGLSRYRRGSIKTMRAQSVFEARSDRTLSPGSGQKMGSPWT